MKTFTQEFQNFTWVDIESPEPKDLMKIADEYNFPLQYFSNCLEPEHFPKLDFIGQEFLWILRTFDEQAPQAASTIQELSTKLVILWRKDILITIHRANISYIAEKRSKVAFENYEGPSELLGYFFQKVVQSYDSILTELENRTDEIEDRVYSLKKSRILRDGYLVKRKASGLKKILKLTQESCSRLANHRETLWTDFNDHRGELERNVFYADDVLENIHGLTGLHIAILSQKTNEGSYKANEVMRVLTVFSIFFLPLNFIAGIYGMNFHNMPETHWPYGYALILTVMAAISIGIYIWVYKKGWLHSNNGHNYDRQDI